MFSICRLIYNEKKITFSQQKENIQLEIAFPFPFATDILIYI